MSVVSGATLPTESLSTSGREARGTCSSSMISVSWWTSWETRDQVYCKLQVYCVDLMWLGSSVWMWTLPQVPAPLVRRTLVPTWESASSSGRITPATAPWPPTLARSAMTVSYSGDVTNTLGHLNTSTLTTSKLLNAQLKSLNTWSASRSQNRQ